MLITPSILVPDEATFTRQITGLDHSVSCVQIDIADGIFVPNTTWADPAVVKKILPMNCELHLMVSNPLKVLKHWAAVEQVERILLHVESVANLDDILPTLHAYGWEIGLVLNPETPLDAVLPYIDQIKRVMVMGVHPGRQGQAFIPETLERIRALKSAHPSMTVAVDGGVSDQTLPDLVAAGTDVVCPGSAIFGNDRQPSDNVERMKERIAALTNQS